MCQKLPATIAAKQGLGIYMAAQDWSRSQEFDDWVWSQRSNRSSSGNERYDRLTSLTGRVAR